MDTPLAELTATLLEQRRNDQPLRHGFHTRAPLMGYAG